MSLFSRLFQWWRGAPLALGLFTARHGRLVGADEQGNKYYQTKDGRRRWVIYDGDNEASRVSADWHGWLHHTYKHPPTRAPLPKKPWELPHRRNMTGTPEAWRPQGSIAGGGARPKVAGDYEAWSPEARSSEGRPPER